MQREAKLKAATAALVSLVLLAGCAAPREAARAPVSVAPAAWMPFYNASIFDAAVFEPGEVATLPSVTADSLTAVTWTEYAGSYVPGDTLRFTWGTVWVTLVPQVQTACRGFAGDSLALRLRLQQLLGLPPDGETRLFATFRVAAADVFRPCTNPSLATTACGETFPLDVPEAHVAWVSEQMLSSYQVPDGYPWTRLGYTYDWNPTTPEVGAFEYVVKKNALVRVLAVATTEDYCRPE